MPTPHMRRGTMCRRTCPCMVCTSQVHTWANLCQLHTGTIPSPYVPDCRAHLLPAQERLRHYRPFRIPRDGVNEGLEPRVTRCFHFPCRA